MKRLAILIIVLFFTGLSGCVSHPQTAEGFRQALIKGAFMTKVETFEVNRPFSEVADTFQKMAPTCLNKTIKTTSSTRQSYQVIVTTYKATVLANPNKAELHVQFTHEKGVLNVSKVPPGGYYMIVTDAQPLGGNKTRIDMYRPSAGNQAMVNAIKG